MPGLDVAGRDGYSSVCCGVRLDMGAQASQHHRILGNRRDNRPSNGLLLQGTGSAGCHWRWHVPDRAEAERLGYVVTKFRGPARTLEVPVWYHQPHLGRVGWYLLDDDGWLTDTGYRDKTLDAREYGETWG